MSITDTTFSSPATTRAPVWTGRLWGVLAVLCVVLFLDGMDVSMVGVALPSIGTELGMPESTLQWLVNGYVLGYGGLLLLGGRTADLLGRRRVFLIALGAFAAASFVGGLVDDGTLLVLTRFIKGLAAAFTAPTAMSILTTTFPEGPARNRALSIFTVFGASGYSSGLILGGVLTSVGWRWTFLTPVPLALGALLFGLRLIPREHTRAEGGHDLWGAVTLTTGMLLAVYTVVTAPERGWLSPLTLASAVVVVGLLTAFVYIENHIAHPLIRLGILRIPTVVRANLSLIALMGSYVSFQFIMTIYLQNVLHWLPMAMALAMLPAGIVVVVGSPLVGKLIDRYGTARLILLSMISLSLGYVWFLVAAGTTPDYPVAILPTMLLLGGGFGFGFSAIMAQGTDGIEDAEQGLAAGLLQTSGQVGSALVLAVVTAVLAGNSHPTNLTAFRPGLNFVTAVAVVGLLLNIVPLLRRGRSAVTRGEPARSTV